MSSRWPPSAHTCFKSRHDCNIRCSWGGNGCCIRNPCGSICIGMTCNRLRSCIEGNPVHPHAKLRVQSHGWRPVERFSNYSACQRAPLSAASRVAPLVDASATSAPCRRRPCLQPCKTSSPSAAQRRRPCCCPTWPGPRCRSRGARSNRVEGHFLRRVVPLACASCPLAFPWPFYVAPRRTTDSERKRICCSRRPAHLKRFCALCRTPRRVR